MPSNQYEKEIAILVPVLQHWEYQNPVSRPEKLPGVLSIFPSHAFVFPASFYIFSFAHRNKLSYQKAVICLGKLAHLG